MYQVIEKFFPTKRELPKKPDRIVLIRTCCIGDVVLATGVLKALRRAYPDSEIIWAVSTWSAKVIEQHPDVDDFLNTGSAALPVYSLRDFSTFVRELRQGQYNLAVSLVRSPLMSLAVFLSGIPYRAGIDSAGRGFGYNLRASMDPDQPRHEHDIYLEVVRQLNINTDDCVPYFPVSQDMLNAMKARLNSLSIERFFIVNPAGGSNPGMEMQSKRYPAKMLAQLTTRLSRHFNLLPVIIAGPNDTEIVDTMVDFLDVPYKAFVGEFSFGEIAALDKLSIFYVGNDTGLTHLAAATGAPTIMILGPSDPARYAPKASRSLALWNETQISQRGVSSSMPDSWNWQTDGITVDDAFQQIIHFMGDLY